MFFEMEETVSSRKARLLGNAALTKAMEECPDISFDSYDRLFPNQDVAPDGGFGNLIALPFQGQAVRNGNSVFLDENMQPFEDQWDALSSFERISKEKLEEAIPDESNDGLGFFACEEQDSKPWEKKNHARPTIKEQKIRAVRANMLFIEKEGLSSQTVFMLRRLAAFANPDYHRAAAMRQSLRNIPRVIYAGMETDEYLVLPRGCEASLKEFLQANSVEHIVDDERTNGRTLDISFVGELRAEQQLAKDALLNNDTGVLSAATGFGKTVLGASLIAELKVPTLVLVPSTALLNQWREQLLKFLDIREELPELLTKTGRKSRKKRSVVGQIGAGKNTPSGIVDVAIPASLFEECDVSGEKRVRNLVKDYGLLICDECHHVPSRRYEEVVRTCNAKHVYGLSATPMRKDGLDPIIFMQCGPIRYEFGSRDQSDAQSFRRILIPRFTRFKIREEDEGKSFTTLMDLLCDDAERNSLIVDDARKLAQQGRTVLVLTRRVEHAEIITERLKAVEAKPLLLTGSDDKKTREAKLNRLKSDFEEFPSVIVATGDYIGEGFDCSKLDALILAAPVSWKGLLAQYAGRLHREHDGKLDVVIYDYADIHVPVFDNMYRKRLKQYSELGYEATAVDRETKISSFYNGESYVKDLIEDIKSAQTSISISSPNFNPKKSSILAPHLAGSAESGVVIDVVIESKNTSNETPNLSDAYEDLKISGVRLSEGERPPCLVIIDDRVVWYGSVNVLAFNKKDSQILRSESRVIAEELSAT